MDCIIKIVQIFLDHFCFVILLQIKTIYRKHPDIQKTIINEFR